MDAISFIDTEIDSQTGKALDFGCINGDGNIFHQRSATAFSAFIKGSKFICGHNIIDHDIKYIGQLIDLAGISNDLVIDTLYLSPLLFPSKPYHALVKDDKLQNDDFNNPLNDAIKAKDLFYDELEEFKNTDLILKDIYYLLLKNISYFKAFFKYAKHSTYHEDASLIIRQRFKDKICNQANLEQLALNHPVELAYSLALINATSSTSITPPWVLMHYPDVERITFLLRNRPCISGCGYCNQALDAHIALKKFFGFDGFRQYGGEPLQQKAVEAAINSKSFLAVFPTGGGKSITFQIPAFISGEATKGLTVVISPLQSLMKDQVDNLEKAGITDAVTINGLLDPIERAKSLERVADGSAYMLYISPESLRSYTIERLLLGRKIVRFVIDEAHCFSSWGQDFRVDYLYIGDFIRNLQEKKNLTESIPISCFTATAKPQVIADICNYFSDKLNLSLELFTTATSRTNLHYKVIPKAGDEEKYLAARDLITTQNCPAIIYVSRTNKAVDIANRLVADQLEARAYHGKMDAKEKTANQNAFLSGDVKIMVATSAFGMGVDKKDVGVVIHYDISDSLENYVQEAGRAGRDENISADCYVLFNEEDLSKHFILLNQTKLSIKEIQQIWKAIKDLTRFRSTVSNSALEIARQAGWDDSVAEIETRVTGAIAALEDAGYLKRGQNSPRVFANSILAKTAQEAINKIYLSERFSEKQKEQATRILKKLFSSKSRKQTNDEIAESRVDYISDHLGIVKEDVIEILYLLREENILADAKDLTAFVKRGDNKRGALNIVEAFNAIEKGLLRFFDEGNKTYQLKELNEHFENAGNKNITPHKIKTVINFWAIKNWIRRTTSPFSKNHFKAKTLHPPDLLKEKIDKHQQLSIFIINYLYKKVDENLTTDKEEVLVEFSVRELKLSYQQSAELFKLEITIEDVEDALFYLSRIEAIKIEGGFLVVYNRLTVERIERDNKKRYKAEDYEKMGQYYESKIQQIHIVGEYAKKMLENYKEALQFVDDYFQLNYQSFLNKYFKGDRRSEINLNLTPTKFRALFGDLSATQLKIIKDKDAKYIVVAAGPGSGKTKVLVHKLASLLIMEDVKHEQLLMLTFSRAAATEFKKRLMSLIGNAAHYIEIKTFHSYCFDLLGRVGSVEKSDTIVKQTAEKIRNGDVEVNRITKTVLVIDEAQDINTEEFGLVSALMEQNEEMRVIAVGDDDQNIYQFRGSDSKHFRQLIEVNGASKYELVENYRSKNNLVDFANQFLTSITHRLKQVPIVAKQSENGRIKIVRYMYGNLIVPLINDIISTPLSGTTCILVKTNEEALQITGSMLQNGLQAKLIQSNSNFNLFDLAEIRLFVNLLKSDKDVHIISKDNWENAKRSIKNTFKASDNWMICQNLIKEFEATNPKAKYLSDLEAFIRESKLEDFYPQNGETIFVSTIHKAKGKEFDNVFLMLENFAAPTDDVKRQLYVAITRAKQNLILHLHNVEPFDNIDTSEMEFVQRGEKNDQPHHLTIQLTHTDVWLDHFINTQVYITGLKAGDTLIVNGDECLSTARKPILKFSKTFLKRINEIAASGYQIKSAKVNFVVYWKREDMQRELQVVLPTVCFERKH